jgi:hypothetical protein
MKFETFLVALLFMSLFMVYAYGEVADAEHWEKVRQLDQLADRFKAETGFTGNVNYYVERMKLQSYEGKFADIPFSADADTISFRQACNRVLDKILPYSFAKRSQLSMGRISKRSGYISTDYYQQVNGYRVEGAGFIVITYDAGRYSFDIGDNAVELPTCGIEPVLSFEDAVRIYDEHVVDDETTKSLRKRRPFLTLFFSNIYNDWEGDFRTEYRLCWVGGYTRCIYIDAITGQVYKTVNKTKYDSK